MVEVVIRYMTKGDWGKTKAYFDVEIGGVTIKSCRLVEGDNGRFVSMPSKVKEDDGGNTTYQTIVFLSDELKDEVHSAAKKRYDEDGEKMKTSDSYKKASHSDDLPF